MFPAYQVVSVTLVNKTCGRGYDSICNYSGHQLMIYFIIFSGKFSNVLV